MLFSDQNSEHNIVSNNIMLPRIHKAINRLGNSLSNTNGISIISSSTRFNLTSSSIRNLSSTPSATAYVFDIDGVLLRGNTALPFARDSLLRLDDAKIPWILLTNGGGELESVKAAKLSEILKYKISEGQVVLSHTPMKSDCAQFVDKRVLVLGCKDAIGVARSYGLKKAVTVNDLCSDDPSRYPFKTYKHNPLPSGDEQIAAVFVFHDPNDWGAELQITIDCLRGGMPLGLGGNSQKIPYYSSNADMTFAAKYPVPRLAAGAFTVALRALWRTLHNGDEIDVIQYGKPQRKQFDFARRQLARWSSSNMNLSDADADVYSNNFNTIFMVGDNPLSDIQGANGAGIPWKSILVRTGVFRGNNDTTHPAKVVKETVKEAVDLSIQ